MQQKHHERRSVVTPFGNLHPTGHSKSSLEDSTCSPGMVPDMSLKAAEKYRSLGLESHESGRLSFNMLCDKSKYVMPVHSSNSGIAPVS